MNFYYSYISSNDTKEMVSVGNEILGCENFNDFLNLDIND